MWVGLVAALAAALRCSALALRGSTGRWHSDRYPADYESAPAVPYVSIGVYRCRSHGSVDG
jgi:hypothetical protein